METENKSILNDVPCKPSVGRNRLVFALLIVWLGSFLVHDLSRHDASGLMVSIMRNWEQYGFVHLKGQFVGNPGGIAAGEEPEIYRGHRPACLFPSYAVGHFFGGAGVSTLPFLLLLSTLTTTAIWFFLRKNSLALVCAVLVPLCYGYTQCARSYDPIGITIVLGIPWMVISVLLICTERKAAILTGVVLMGVYSQLNWPVVFPLAAASVYLIVRLQKRPLVVLSFILVALAGLAAVTYSTVSAKIPSNLAGEQPHDLLWQTYLWGANGYDGHGMTLGKMLVRNVLTTTPGLLPVFLLLGFLCLRGGVPRNQVLLSLAPLAVSVIGVLGMRNLFGHHPWMSGPPVLCGTLFSIGLLQLHGGSFDLILRRAAAWIAVGVAYCLLWVAVLAACNANTYTLGSLVSKNTQRGSLIVLMPDVGPAFYDAGPRWTEIFDRKVVRYADWMAGGKKDQASVIEFSSKAELEGRHPFARSSELGKFDHLLMQAIGYYRTRISKRAAGDCLETGEAYYLYHVN